MVKELCGTTLDHRGDLSLWKPLTPESLDDIKILELIDTATNVFNMNDEACAFWSHYHTPQPLIIMLPLLVMGL